jgi:hypothetical protein
VRNLSSLFILIVVLCLISAITGSAGEQPPISSPGKTAVTQYSAAQGVPPSDTFVTVNKNFEKRYEMLVEKTKSSLGPIILQCGSSLFLIRNGREEKASAFDHRYRVFEAMSHIPVTLFVMLRDITDRKLTDTELIDLRTFRQLVVDVRDALPNAELTPIQLDRSARIIRNAIAFIDDGLTTGQVLDPALRRYVRSQAGDIEANLRDAADDQISIMDKQFKLWTGEMSSDERGRLKVIVCGPHMARTGNISMQYMAIQLDKRFMGRCQEEPILRVEKRQLIYAESFDRQKDITLLAEHSVDAELGKAVFDDPARMHRDVLGNSAENLLEHRFKRTKFNNVRNSCGQ